MQQLIKKADINKMLMFCLLSTVYMRPSWGNSWISLNCQIKVDPFFFLQLDCAIIKILALNYGLVLKNKISETGE